MDTVRRFSNRVENYVKYRPSYPPALVEFLTNRCQLTTGSAVADIGSGTGIFTRLLLDQDFQVYGVEPGNEMRAVAEKDFSGNPNFSSVPSRAEDTGLSQESINLVTVAQAFHWMQIPAFRAECLRILKPGGWVAIIWNNRRKSGTPFLEEYEVVLRTLETDYTSAWVNRVNTDSIAEFFGGSPFKKHTFSNQQSFGWGGFLGRVLSSSYVPLPGDPKYPQLESSLRRIFESHAADGQIVFEYDTELYLGQLRD